MNKRIRLQEVAIKRLALMGVSEELIRELKREFSIKVTHISGDIGKVESIHQEALKSFEERKIEGLPFYMIESYINGYQQISILFVGKDESDWEYESELIEDGFHFAYVYNVDNPRFSELGDIAFSIEGEVLYRIG